MRNQLEISTILSRYFDMDFILKQQFHINKVFEDLTSIHSSVDLLANLFKFDKFLPTTLSLEVDDEGEILCKDNITVVSTLVNPPKAILEYHCENIELKITDIFKKWKINPTSDYYLDELLSKLILLRGCKEFKCLKHCMKVDVLSDYIDYMRDSYNNCLILLAKYWSFVIHPKHFATFFGGNFTQDDIEKKFSYFDLNIHERYLKYIEIQTILKDTSNLFDNIKWCTHHYPPYGNTLEYIKIRIKEIKIRVEFLIKNKNWFDNDPSKETAFYCLEKIFEYLNKYKNFVHKTKLKVTKKREGARREDKDSALQYMAQKDHLFLSFRKVFRDLQTYVNKQHKVYLYNDMERYFIKILEND